MDIRFEKERILNIYDEVSSKGLYKKANTMEKFLAYILPLVLFFIFCIMCVVCEICNNTILEIISLILLIFSILYQYIAYEIFRKKKYNLIGKQKYDSHYNKFIEVLDENGIKQNEINFFIELLLLDNNPSEKIRFSEYISLILIPGLMIYFNDSFEKVETIIFLFYGLFFIPVFIYIVKIIAKQKNSKFDTILEYLKRRSIELKYNKK
jgi:hypothetical protein